MPASRMNARNRRRSSLVPITPAKAGTYSAPSRPNFSFAPNITPVSYVDPSDSDSEEPTPQSPSALLFPPSDTPAPPPARKRQPPGKRRSQGYIPRPPNAFMLFRADFVRQKHVPGSIETNHGSLSKIIGNCWHKLPPEQKKIWDKRAKEAKVEHKKLYPNYRFKPVHNKNKNKKEKVGNVEEERRCEEVAQLLLEGMKGAELARAVKVLDLDRMRSLTPQQLPRRSSSVPLPGDYYGHGHGQGIALPSIPFLQPTSSHSQDQVMRRPSSAFDSSKYNPYTFGFRRPSAQFSHFSHPHPVSFPFSFNGPLQMDAEPLPDADTSLFNPGFNLAFGSQDAPPPYQQQAFEMSELIPPLQLQNISPLDNSIPSPEAYPTPATLVDNGSPYADPRMLDNGVVSTGGVGKSAGSTVYDGTPEPAELVSSSMVHAPVPLTPATNAMFESSWTGFEQQQQQQQDSCLNPSLNPVVYEQQFVDSQYVDPYQQTFEDPQVQFDNMWQNGGPVYDYTQMGMGVGVVDMGDVPVVHAS